MIDLIELLKLLSDKTRLRILNLLYKGKRFVCEIVVITQLPQSTVSRHLSKLRLANVVKTKRRGQLIEYKINEDIFEQYSFLKELFDKDTSKIKELMEDEKKAKYIGVKDDQCLL